MKKMEDEQKEKTRHRAALLKDLRVGCSPEQLK